MSELSEEGRRRLAEVAERHGVAPATAEHLLASLVRGGGNQAQFDSPELGGMGQWSRGGMIMIGDMFNNALKARVDALCSDLAALVGEPGLFRPARPGSAGAGGWPAELGTPSASGGQNDMRYAIFPATRRLAVAHGGTIAVYDTGDHHIGGISQAQAGEQSLTFTSQLGPVRLSDLPRIGGEPPRPVPPAPQANADPVPRPVPPAPQAAADPAPRLAPTAAPRLDVPPAPGAGPAVADADPVRLIERLAELHARGILTDEEFVRKKSELLARL